MRHFFLLIALLFVLLVSCSRQNKTSTSDIAIADTIIKHHEDSFYTHPKETEQHFLAIQKKLKDSGAKNRLELYIGMLRLYRGDRKALNNSMRIVYAFCKSHPDDYRLAGIYWNDKGIVGMMDGMRDSAVVWFQRSYYNHVLAGDTSRACAVSTNLAGLYREKGEMAKAATTLREAMQMSHGHGGRQYEFMMLYILAAVYADMESYNMSDMYFNRAEKMIDQASMNGKFMFYNARGNRYFYAKNYSRSLNDHQTSAKIAYALNDKVYQAIAESNVGELLSCEGRNKEALPKLLDAEKEIKTSGFGDARSLAYLNDLIASVEVHNGNYAEANKRFTATDTSAYDGSPRYLMVHFDRLADYYKLTNNLSEAYVSIEKARTYEKIMRDDLFREQMAEAHQRYLRDKKVTEQNIEIERQKEHSENLGKLVGAIVIVAVFFMVIIVLAANRKRQLMELRFRGELTRLSLQNIRNRLSPHFIMNVLGREVSPDNEGIIRLIRFIRQNLSLIDHGVITIKEELEFVRRYVELERKSLSKNFTFNCDISKDVKTEKVYIPAMMIQLFVENAVKHGLRGQQGQLFLNIKVAKTIEGLCITIDKNGSNTQGSELSTHTGLKVIRQTLDLYNKNNIKPVKLEYGLRDRGVWHVSLLIPDNYKFIISNGKGK